MGAWTGDEKGSSGWVLEVCGIPMIVCVGRTVRVGLTFKAAVASCIKSAGATSRISSGMTGWWVGGLVGV